ncbi:MAG: ubiquinol-cytochrome c reductase iron-sulfur subunit [Betaproteobacteria bacterium]|nr:ubiquinol-cytochrome c reductase iron-sulfur subunit [Betaproteobacteria bacterium]
MDDQKSWPRPMNPTRRKLVVAASAAGTVAAVGSAIPLVASLAPSERARAASAPVEADFSKLVPGELMTVEWRGKPVWILRRTPEMIERLKTLDTRLRDPESEKPQQPEYCQNPWRSRKPEFFIAVAICTHLGCVPTFRKEVAPADLGPEWPGGFYCPCHGSKFDFAGRVFRNVPAPLNLEVPRHKYLADTRLLVGEDQDGA